MTHAPVGEEIRLSLCAQKSRYHQHKMLTRIDEGNWVKNDVSMGDEDLEKSLWTRSRRRMFSMLGTYYGHALQEHYGGLLRWSDACLGDINTSMSTSHDSNCLFLFFVGRGSGSNLLPSICPRSARSPSQPQWACGRHLWKVSAHDLSTSSPRDGLNKVDSSGEPLVAGKILLDQSK